MFGLAVQDNEGAEISANKLQILFPLIRSFLLFSISETFRNLGVLDSEGAYNTENNNRTNNICVCSIPFSVFVFLILRHLVF